MFRFGGRRLFTRCHFDSIQANRGANHESRTHQKERTIILRGFGARGNLGRGKALGEFRLCWPSVNSIEYVSGGEAKIPLIIVKLTDDRETEFECYDILMSPTERIDDDYKDDEYQVHGRLLWGMGDNYWVGVFAVPLFTIENEEDVKRELVSPVHKILTSVKQSPEEIESTAFAQTKEAFRWRLMENGHVTLDMA
jgi:hypothetical protein